MNIFDHVRIAQKDGRIVRYEFKAESTIIEDVIAQGKTDRLIDFAEGLAPLLKKEGLTTSQIRNIFGSVKQIEMDWDWNKLQLLKPRLAYVAAKSGAKGTELLRDVLTEAITEVADDQKKFERFVNFFEAILAYHKAAGGK